MRALLQCKRFLSRAFTLDLKMSLRLDSVAVFLFGSRTASPDVSFCRAFAAL
jgi:hypothetical protein